MYYNKVELCGVNTAKLKTLNDEEKRALLLRVKEGDADARRELIDGNLRLVLSIVQRFANRRENMDDLFQVGCIGLIKAVDNFNTDLNVKFSTYAVPMNVRRGNQAAPMDGKSRQLVCCRLQRSASKAARSSSVVAQPVAKRTTVRCSSRRSQKLKDTFSRSCSITSFSRITKI